MAEKRRSKVRYRLAHGTAESLQRQVQELTRGMRAVREELERSLPQRRRADLARQRVPRPDPDRARS